MFWLEISNFNIENGIEPTAIFDVGGTKWDTLLKLNCFFLDISKCYAGYSGDLGPPIHLKPSVNAGFFVYYCPYMPAGIGGIYHHQGA
jgi:hypothetical protein